MRIYITTQGSRVIKEGRHLLVQNGENIHRTIFVHKVQQLIVCGNVEITSAARNMLFSNNIDTLFLTRNGRYLGRFANLEPKNVFLRQKQFCKVGDTSFCLDFARQVVAGKLGNMSVLLMRIYRKKRKEHIAEKAKAIRRLLGQVATAETVDSLRGYEGRGSALYFSLFNSGFDTDQGFTGRVRQPPTDPVNAILSLLYTFLYNQVYCAIRQVNLDPYLGALHSLDYGRYSLVLDLMEEFRPVIVDTLVFALFNMGILQRDKDFTLVQDEEVAGDAIPEPVSAVQAENELFDTPVQRITELSAMPPASAVARRPVHLHRDAMKKVIAQFERKLATSFQYEREKRKITYTEAIVSQVRQYRKLIEGSVRSYEPLRIR